MSTGPLVFQDPFTSPRSGIVLVSQHPDRLFMLISPERYQKIVQASESGDLDRAGALFLAATACCGHSLEFVDMKVRGGQANDHANTPGYLPLMFEFLIYAAYLAMRESGAFRASNRLSLLSPTGDNDHTIRFWGYACVGLLRELGCLESPDPLDCHWDGSPRRRSFSRRIHRYVGSGRRRAPQTLAQYTRAAMAEVDDWSLLPALDIVPPLLESFGNAVRQMVIGDDLSPMILDVAYP